MALKAFVPSITSRMGVATKRRVNKMTNAAPMITTTTVERMRLHGSGPGLLLNRVQPQRHIQNSEYFGGCQMSMTTRHYCTRARYEWGHDVERLDAVRRGGISNS